MNVSIEQVIQLFIFDGDNFTIGRSFRKYITIKLIELMTEEINNEEII